MNEGAVFDIEPTASISESLRPIGVALQMLLKSGPQRVTIETIKPHRSLEQNDMFRGLCRDAAEWWNANRAPKTSPGAIARDLKVTYGVILTEWSPVTDKRTARIESTKRYSKQQMGDLITATLAWAASEGIPLPDPRERRAAE